mgnify:CR=1 FL=1|jgi:hypothetical protein
MTFFEFFDTCKYILNNMDLDDNIEITLNKYHSFHLNPLFAHSNTGPLPYIKHFNIETEEYRIMTEWSTKNMHQYIGKDNKKFDIELLRHKLRIK